MTLLEQLSNLDALTSVLMGGAAVQLQPIAGDVPVVQVSIEGREELPIFITCSDSQLLCLCYLWTEADIRPDRRAELLEALRAELAARGSRLPVVIGNRNWRPFVSEALRALADGGARRVLAITTSAYGSYSGCRQYRY